MHKHPENLYVACIWHRVPVVCGFEFLSLTDKIQHIFGSRKCYFIPLALQEKKERTQKITIQCNKTNQRKSRYCCRSAQLFCKVALCFSHATVDSSVIKNYTSTCSFFPLKKKMYCRPTEINVSQDLMEHSPTSSWERFTGEVPSLIHVETSLICSKAGVINKAGINLDTKQT